MEREISIILKVKGAKQAKEAITGLFNDQTKKSVEGFNKSTKKTGDNMKRVNKHSQQAGKSMQSFTKILGRGMAALYLYNRAWAVFGRNFESGLQLERASTQFERHVGNVTKMLPELRSATHGVIADFDLLRTANRAFQQGIRPEQMASTFRLATSAAQKLGLEARDAIQTITDAVTTQNEGSLKTLGIITNVNQEYQTQAALIAKNGGVMSKAMSIQLRQSLIMQELQKRFGGANRAQEDGLMILERFKASWKNFRAAIGETLGLALLPLTRAFTAVLDVTTRLLDKLNDTRGFKSFVQVAATLAGIFAGAKFLLSIRSLLGLFGFFGGVKAAKMPRMLRATNNLLAKFGKVVGLAIPQLGKFGGSMARILGLSTSFARLIPGWGVAITALSILFTPLMEAFSKTWLTGKVLFQLLNNFDRTTGMSRVLKKDAEGLGRMYNLIENVAKISLEVWAVLRGIGQGIGEAFRPVISVVSWATNQITNFAGWLVDVDKIAVQSGSRLDSLTNRVKNLTKYLGFASSVLAMFIPGMQGMGLAGATLFGGQILKDLGAVDALQGAMSRGSDQSWQARTGIPQLDGPPDQSFTGRETPTPSRAVLDYGDEQKEINKKMLKVLEKQTTMMEVDAQKKDIEKSQQDARSNIWVRR